MLTLKEYLDPKRFPATTNPSYKPKTQLMMDAFNHDSLAEMIEIGVKKMDAEQEAIWAELTEKIKDNARLAGEVADAEAQVYKGAAAAIKADREWEAAHGEQPKTKGDEILRRLD